MSNRTLKRCEEYPDQRYMDAVDRRIINELQGSFPVCARPFAEAGKRFAISEDELIRRIEALLSDGILTRFGPLYHAERLGGALTLCAMAVPAARFDQVAEQVNSLPEVAHNYERDHRLNMWFVLAVGEPARIGEVIGHIEAITGLQVLNMPKLEEFYVGLQFAV